MAIKVVTIGRKFGSGGRFVGQKLAERLGFAFYDRDIIKLVAKSSGYAMDFIEETGEYSVGSYITAGVYGDNLFPSGLAPSDIVNIIQSRVIGEIADKGNCVIIGRAADYILRGRTDTLNAFVFADRDECLRRAVDIYGLPEKDAAKTIKKNDRQRAGHYSRYTGRKWGMAENYHISIDSGKLGIEGCVEVLARAVTAAEPEEQ